MAEILNKITDKFPSRTNVFSGVYELWFGDKVYVGSSKSVYTRLVGHRTQIKNKTHRNRNIQRESLSFPFEEIKIKIMPTKAESLIKVESALTEKHMKLGNSLNIDIGNTPSVETIDKNRIRHTGKVASKETREKISLARMGRKFSKESKEKMSKKAKGRKVSQNTRKKLSESQRKADHSHETKYYYLIGEDGKKLTFKGMKEVCIFTSKSRDSVKRRLKKGHSLFGQKIERSCDKKLYTIEKGIKVRNHEK